MPVATAITTTTTPNHAAPKSRSNRDGAYALTLAPQTTVATSVTAMATAATVAGVSANRQSDAPISLRATARATATMLTVVASPNRPIHESTKVTASRGGAGRALVSGDQRARDEQRPASERRQGDERDGAQGQDIAATRGDGVRDDGVTDGQAAGQDR